MEPCSFPPLPATCQQQQINFFSTYVRVFPWAPSAQRLSCRIAEGYHYTQSRDAVLAPNYLLNLILSYLLYLPAVVWGTSTGGSVWVHRTRPPPGTGLGRAQPSHVLPAGASSPGMTSRLGVTSPCPWWGRGDNNDPERQGLGEGFVSWHPAGVVANHFFGQPVTACDSL